MHPESNDYHVVEKSGLYKITSGISWGTDGNGTRMWNVEEISREEILPKNKEQYPDIEFI